MALTSDEQIRIAARMNAEQNTLAQKGTVKSAAPQSEVPTAYDAGRNDATQARDYMQGQKDAQTPQAMPVNPYSQREGGSSLERTRTDGMAIGNDGQPFNPNGGPVEPRSAGPVRDAAWAKSVQQQLDANRTPLRNPGAVRPRMQLTDAERAAGASVEYGAPAGIPQGYGTVGTPDGGFYVSGPEDFVNGPDGKRRRFASMDEVNSYFASMNQPAQTPQPAAAPAQAAPQAAPAAAPQAQITPPPPGVDLDSTLPAGGKIPSVSVPGKPMSETYRDYGVAGVLGRGAANVAQTIGEQTSSLAQAIPQALRSAENVAFGTEGSRAINSAIKSTASQFAAQTPSIAGVGVPPSYRPETPAAPAPSAPPPGAPIVPREGVAYPSMTPQTGFRPPPPGVSLENGLPLGGQIPTVQAPQFTPPPAGTDLAAGLPYGAPMQTAQVPTDPAAAEMARLQHLEQAYPTNRFVKEAMLARQRTQPAPATPQPAAAEAPLNPNPWMNSTLYPRKTKAFQTAADQYNPFARPRSANGVRPLPE